MRRSGPGTFSFNQNFGLLDCFVAIAPRNDAIPVCREDDQREDEAVQ